MKNVYIYDGSLKIIATPYITTETEFLEVPKKFYPDFSDSHYYSFEKLVNPVIDGNKLREMKRVELVLAGKEDLQDGEYIKNNEIVTVEKPNDFHFWDNNKNEWVYDQEVEINSLEEELGSLEMGIYNFEQEIKNLKEVGKTFSLKKAAKLEEEVAELDKTYQGKLKRYEELEG